MLYIQSIKIQFNYLCLNDVAVDDDIGHWRRRNCDPFGSHRFELQRGFPEEAPAALESTGHHGVHQSVALH